MTNRTDLELSEELFQFLQGVMPEGYRLDDEKVPHLTPDQAWTVIWYLGNLYWQPSDMIERCDLCGELYDANSEGECIDGGDPPFFFCDGCIGKPEYDTKLRSWGES